MSLVRRLTAEGIGSLLLAAAVWALAIMAERLAGGNAAVALLANTEPRSRSGDPDRALRAGERCALQPGGVPGPGRARAARPGQTAARMR